MEGYCACADVRIGLLQTDFAFCAKLTFTIAGHRSSLISSSRKFDMQVPGAARMQRLTRLQTNPEAVADSECVSRIDIVVICWLTRNTNAVRAGFKSMCFKGRGGGWALQLLTHDKQLAEFEPSIPAKSSQYPRDTVSDATRSRYNPETRGTNLRRPDSPRKHAARNSAPSSRASPCSPTSTPSTAT